MSLLFFGDIRNGILLFESENQRYINTAAQISETRQWIKNPTLDSPIEPIWFWENGTEGDNSDVNATSGSDQANFEVLGETRTFTVVSGIINSSSSLGWKQFNKTGFLLPDTAEITGSGGYVYHFWNDDPNQFPSVQWKNNISLPIDMSDYTITSASLKVIVNATVSVDVDTPNDSGDWENFAIGDSVTFYSQISDLAYDTPIYTVASNKTKYLGQNSPSILTLADSKLESVSEADLITALNSAFDKDTSHSNFTLTLGIDIYSEDNLGAADPDTYNELIIKSCNLTFTVEKKIDLSTTTSWNQICNKISGASIQIIDANFNFKYKIDKIWPNLAPLSELRFFINNKSYDVGTIKLSSANTSFQEAIAGGFDVTDLISANVNISVSIELFLKDAFDLGEVYTISIDDVYLNISYINIFPDYGSEIQLFVDNENKTANPVVEIAYFDVMNITVTYKENTTGNHISNSTVMIEGKVSGNLTEDQTFNQYYILVNASDLGLGANILTINAQKDNYESKSVQIFVDVVEQATKIQLIIDNVERNINQTMDFRFNEMLNVTVLFKNNFTNNHINGATVNLLGLGKFNETGNQYNLTLDTNKLKQGINILTIFAQLDNYQSQSIQFFINIIEVETRLLVFVEGNQTFESDVVNSQNGEFLNITIHYQNNQSKEHINGSSVDLLGFGSFSELNNQYNFSLNTSTLVQGINVLTIFAQFTNYQSQTFQFFIEIEERATNLQLLIEDIQIYPSDTVKAHFNELLNITVFYKDNNTNMHINGTNVELLGIGFLNETSYQYNISLDTNTLAEGINILTIFAQLDNYQFQTIQFFINIVDIETKLLLYIDGNQTFDSDVFNSQNSEYLNITVHYQNNQTDEHINGASVALLGFGSFSEFNNQFNFSINTNNLVQGINVLTIFAQLTNYQSQTFQFFINIEERATILQLFIDNLQIFPSDTVNTPFDELLNITVLYKDKNTNMHINGTNVELLGIGFLNETSYQYNISLDTNTLAKGINILTIFAQQSGFQHKTIQFFINVDDREAELVLFIEGVQLNDSDTIQIEIDENMNITALLNDKITGLPLIGANVELLGIGTLNETLIQYNITINSNDLELGINIINIFAQVNKYQPSSIQVFIEVVKKTTNLFIYLDGIDKTNDPTVILPITSTLNLTIKYLHNQSGLEISGAIIELIGEGLTEFLIWDTNFLQYSVILNTSTLGIGVKSFTTVAQAPEFQVNFADINLIINRINTDINVFSGEPYIDISSESDYRIQIVLNNTDFGGIIKNATVTYRWERGSGELTDFDYDGIYEAVLQNVPAGSFVITITAYIGEDYEFQTFEIFLNAGAQPGFDLTLIIALLSFGIVGIGTYFVLYQKYLKYPPKVRKIRKLRKRIKKNKKLKPITIQTRDDILKSNLEMNKQLIDKDKLTQSTLTKEGKHNYKKKKGGDLFE